MAGFLVMGWSPCYDLHEIIRESEFKDAVSVMQTRF